METTQTAVDWFFDNLKNHEVQSEHFGLYQQAKAMEKQQIMKSFNEGTFANDEKIKAEQYYKETYGS